MKKLCLLMAILLLAVLTIVACTQTETPETPKTTTDATTEAITEADNATQASTQISEEATQAVTSVVTDATTDAPETPTSAPETPTEPVVTEAPTEPVTEAPYDPNAPIYLMDADFIAEKANTPDDPFTAKDIAFAQTTEEDGYQFVRIATCGPDPYIAIIPLGSNMYLTNYLVVSYRNNSLYPGQFYMGSGSGWTGSGDFFKANWKTNNEWDLMIVDLSATGMTSIVEDIFTYTRIDIFDGNVTEDEWIDIEFIAFFETPEQAVAYYEARHGKLENGYNDNSVDTPMPAPPVNDQPNDDKPTQNPDVPSYDSGELLEFDLSKLNGKGYESSNAALGNSHTGPVFNLVDGYIQLGNIDLSQYSKCEIIYSTTNDKDNFDKNGPHIIGLKNEASSYGFDKNYNETGDIAHVEMVFSSGGYSDLRVAEIDLTNVTYNGVVYVTGHNVWIHSIFIVGIKLIP